MSILIGGGHNSNEQEQAKFLTKQETGSVMIEFSIALLFLLSTLFLTLDVGLALNQYARLARVTYEGTRYASAIAGLDGGGPYTTSLSSCEDSITGIPQQHIRLQQRLVELLCVNDLFGTNVQISTTYSKRDTLIINQPNPDVVTVRLETNYFPLIPLYAGSNVPMKIEISGPYLYRQRG